MYEQQLFDKYFEGKHWKQHPTTYAASYAQFLSSQNFSGLLVDVGCGNGRDVAFFHQAGFKVAGIDYSLSEINTARDSQPRCSFLVANCEEIPFRDQAIGAYFMINVIHYVDPRQTLAELHRTLQKEGYLFVHFNLDITDEDGKQDYHQEEDDINSLIFDYRLVGRQTFQRVDTLPKPNTHTILELILQK